jgi:hypothetical protein
MPGAAEDAAARPADAGRRADAVRQIDRFYADDPDGPVETDGPVIRRDGPGPGGDARPADAAPDGPCMPTTCMVQGADCGTISDGCGGMLTCGAMGGNCMMPQSCGGGGVANQCGADRRWPLWRMPDSPTVYCTDGVVMEIPCADTAMAMVDGQDGNSRINVPTYTSTADTVTDSVTGLVWQRAVGAVMTHANARRACQMLAVGGTGWRLPTRIELVTIVDYGRPGPAIEPIAFPMTPAEEFWSASPFGGDPTNLWTVDFASGILNTANDTMTRRVRCVR